MWSNVKHGVNCLNASTDFGTLSMYRSSYRRRSLIQTSVRTSLEKLLFQLSLLQTLSTCTYSPTTSVHHRPSYRHVQKLENSYFQGLFRKDSVPFKQSFMLHFAAQVRFIPLELPGASPLGPPPGRCPWIPHLQGSASYFRSSFATVPPQGSRRNSRHWLIPFLNTFEKYIACNPCHCLVANEN